MSESLALSKAPIENLLWRVWETETQERLRVRIGDRGTAAAAAIRRVVAHRLRVKRGGDHRELRAQRRAEAAPGSCPKKLTVAGIHTL